MAHKKAQWSTSNGRDSRSKRLGVKLFWWQKVISGNIIIRQKWNKYYPSQWVSQWKDFTLFATADGIVKFFKKTKIRYDWRKYIKTYVSVA